MLARDVLALTGAQDSDSAYLAGLLHDIGKPVVATVLLELERQLTEVYQRGWIDSGEWLNVIAKVHRPVAVVLAEKWALPPPIIACVKEAAEYDQANRHSLANAVCFANALAKKSGIYAGPLDAEDNDALVMIGRSVIGISDDILRTLTKGLRERVTGLYD
jgi:HD-like signal output (HDOD) protein